MICLTPKRFSEIISVSLSTVYKAKKKFPWKKSFFRKSGSGWKKPKEGFLTAHVTIKKDTTTSVRKHTSEFKVHEKTVRVAIKQDLKLKSLATTIFEYKEEKKQGSRVEKMT